MSRTVTALEIQKRNKERVNVYLDGEFAFGLNALAAARLHKGQTLSDEEIRTLQAEDDVAVAYERAVSFLSYRPRSIAEIRKNLAEKAVSDSNIDEVIERLLQQGYVDDLAFARFWVSNRQEFRPRGARALRFELREKGISNEIIDEVLGEVDTTEAAYRVAHDKAKRLRGSSKKDFRQKIGSLLARRGFTYDAVREVTDRLIEALTEEDAGFFGVQDNDEYLE